MNREQIYESYLKENYNCAETILRVANAEYNLGITEDDIKLASGFGGGMGVGSTCGALVGCIAVLGKLFVETKDHETEGFRERCAEFYQQFVRELGAADCETLKATYKKDETTKCITTIEKAAKVLNDYLVAAGKAAPKAEKVTLKQEDITRVKALGFLHNKGTNKFNCRVITRNGKITAREQMCIAEAAEKYGDGHVAMTTRLTMEITGVDYENIEPIRAHLAQAGLMTGGTGSKVRPVVACKGTTCQYGLCDTFHLSNLIHERFFMGYSQVKLPHKFKIAVGGCPNNCVKPDLNDLGIIGQRVPKVNTDLCRGCKKCVIENTCPVKVAKLVDGVMQIAPTECNHCGRCIGKCPFKAIESVTYGYKVVIGGRWGKKYAHGIALNQVFTSEEEVLSVVEKAILYFREQGKTGERFSDTIARIGFEKVEAELLSDDILSRKEAIIGTEMHMVGGATC